MRTSTTRSTPPLEAAVYGAGASVAGACVAMFVATAGAPSPDPAGAYADLKGLYGALGAVTTWPWAATVALTHFGGWYALILAAAIRLTGRPEAIYVLATTLWLATVVATASFTALRLGGRGAAAITAAGVTAAGVTAAVVLCAAALLGGASATWATLPEAGLACILLAVAVGDPALARPGARLAVSVTGALLVAFAPAGLLWVLTLVPVLLGGWRWEPRGYAGRLVAALAPWVLGLAPAIWALTAAPPTLTLPLAEGSEAVAPPYTTVLGVLAVLGIAGNLGVAEDRGGARRVSAAVRWVLGSWLVLSAGACLLTAVGVANLPMLLPAGAILTGTGVATLVSGGFRRVRPVDLGA